MSLNSEKIFAGVEHADARSLLYATGHLQENIGRKPLIGVVNTFNEIVPGHFHLRGIADAAKQLGGKVKFVDAVHFIKGEGIEKKQEDFAAEVAAQMNMGK